MKTNELMFESIVHNYIKKNLRYKKKKNEILINKYLTFWCSITIVYLILKIAKIINIGKSLETILMIILILCFLGLIGYDFYLNFKNEKPFFKYYQNRNLIEKIDDIYQALIIRIQKNDSNDTLINTFNLLKTIFVFFFGFYFSNYLSDVKYKLTFDNVIVVSLFTFFVVLSSTLLLEVIKLILNKNNLKYECLLEEIEEYKLTSINKKYNLFKKKKHQSND